MGKSINSVKVIRSRRKTVSVEVTRELEVVVRAPMALPEAEICRFLAQKADWIEKARERMRHRLTAAEAQPSFPPSELRTLAERMAREFPPRVAAWAARLGVRYGRITVRAQHTRWGSCSSKGNLNFNCLLMLCPEEVQDYVIVHELCHRREMNHSPRFWALVESVLPDYERRRAWLKKNGAALIARLPKG